MKKMQEKTLNPLINLGISPLNIHLEFHSIGGISITDQNFEDYIKQPLRAEGVNILSKNAFSDYRTMPGM